MPTTRLGLVQPANTDSADIAVIHNPQMDKIDSILEALVVPNSGSYPLTPFDGQIIWDKALKLLLLWSASTTQWVELLSPNWGFGKVDYKKFTGSASINNTEGGPYMSITMTQRTGRKYRINYSVNMSTPSTNFSGGTQARIRASAAGGTSVSVSDSLIYSKYMDYDNVETGGEVPYQGWTEFQAVTTGLITIGWFMYKDNTSGNATLGASTAENNFWIEDIGQ